MLPRKFWLLLVAITLVAFGLRLWIAAEYQGLSSPPDLEANPDQGDYEALGWRLAAGAGFSHEDGTPTAFRAPGTPVLIETVYIVFGHNRAAVRVVFCLLSALTCLLAGMIAAEAFGNLAGLFAALLLALLPNHVYYAQHMLSETPYAFAIAVACLWVVLSRQERGYWLFDLGAGLMFGLAFLTRPQSALCMPIFGCLALLGATRSRRAALLQIARMGSVFALVVVPWMVRNQIELGTLAPTTLSGQVFWGAHNSTVAADPDLVGSWIPIEGLVDEQHRLPQDEPGATRAAWGYGLDFLREHPGEVPRLLFWKLVRQYSPFQWTPNRLVYWSFAIAWLVVGPLCVVGLWLGWRRSRANVIVLLVPMLSTLATGLVFYGAGRFRDGEAGLYVVLAGAALAAVAPLRWKAWAGDPVPTA
ncbi:MAG: glycosyltransferase family 39 protein [Planctomycetes bacterium]|nr:glycosyltransferase family 39 protein [Planctomycetota bacterium]